MIENWLQEVQKTRRLLMSARLETILNEFDGHIMGLDHEGRRRKYRQMAENPFRFFRGSTYLFYYDVTRIPFSFHTPDDKPTWIQGDMHVENFGAFQNSAGDIVYDANDFDEGCLGSYLYDVLRMTVSIALYCDQHGFSDAEERMKVFLQSYYRHLKRFVKGKEDPVTFFYTEDNTKGPVKKALKKSEKRDSSRLLDKWTEQSEDGTRVFALSDELVAITSKEREKIMSVWPDYIASLDEEDRNKSAFYEVKDIVRKIGSGTASIGLDRFYILIEGKEGEKERDDIVLEMKEVRAPVPAYFFPYNESFWEAHPHQGERVITTQKAMHHLDDPLLGYVTIDKRHFYVRERSPYKKRVKPEDIENEKELDKMMDVFGGIAAKIHARADADIEHHLLDYHSEEEILKAIGDDYDVFEEQIIFVSRTYKEQVKQDYVLFCGWMNRAFI